MRRCVAVLLLLLSSHVVAADPEIDFLLGAVAQSHCTFIRNGESHSAEEAADHLRMKYKRARWLVDDAEEFIERIASQSSMSGEPYTMQCDGGDLEPTQAWLTARLDTYRAQPVVPQD